MFTRAQAAPLLLVACIATGCDDDATSKAEASPAVTAADDQAPGEEAEPSEADARAEATEACRARIAELKEQPALEGTPEFEENRLMMARVRGRDMMWRRRLEARPKLDEIVEDNDTSVKVVRAFRRAFRDIDEKEKRRQLVLREGYLWHRDTKMALAMVEQVSLPKLYPDESTVYIQRGVDIYGAKWEGRTKLHHERFVYTEGPYAGQKAEVLLGDRVSDDRSWLEQTPPLAIDLRDLMHRSTFDRIEPQHLTEEALVARVRYGSGTWAPAVLELDGAKATLVCEALDEETAEAKRSFVGGRAMRRKAMVRLREVVRKMVKEQIPFDADDGQTMGFLRKAWKRAYFKGWRRFKYEGELRYVYSNDGAPMPPQVCIDFLTDCWERASGTWYAPYDGEGDPEPKRTEGAIDFDDAGVENRRSVKEFTDFTKENPELFDVWAVPKDERHRFEDREVFFGYLEKEADQFLPGDMITIHGYKEGGRPHYHSLIILEKDPITGVPTLVAGNAAIPREQTLEGVMQISPERSLRHRIRVKEPWLKALAEHADGSP